MQDERERERAKIDGRASFAGAAYLIGIGLIYLLARVGAPDGLVRALGPLFALAGIGLVGLLTRSARTPAFFTADRAIPAPYAGLAFAGIAAGLVLCLESRGESPAPLAGVAAGLCIGALAVGPLLRATRASALGDLLATRFPSPALRLFLAALLFAIGALVAAAGFEAAVNALVALFEPSRGAAAAIVALTIVLILVPGGVAGLLWSAAAGAGIILIILTLPIAAQFFTGDSPLGPGIRDARLWGDALAHIWGAGDFGDPKAHWLVVAASALAVATLPLLATTAVASSSESQALRAGGCGLLFAALIALAVFVDLVVRPAPLGPISSGLKSSATLLAALILAGAGVHSASRAWGMNMSGPASRYAPLASQRLARSRAAMIAVVALCAGLTVRAPLDPMTAIVAAAALSLGLMAPLVALAFFSRATPVHAAVSTLASIATALVVGLLERRMPDAGRLLLIALSAAAAGFALGWSAAIFSPGQRELTPARQDMFIDAPLDPGG
jgi:hypothetical protein